MTDPTEASRGASAPVTTALIAANAGVFAAELALAGHVRFALGGSAPSERVLWNGILRQLGGNDSTYTIADVRLETLVTSCFLHGSILHLGFNLLVLWQVGPFLERTIGRARFLPLYLGAGIAGSAASAIAGRLLGPSLSIGASGALCGLIGAMLVLGARTQGWRGPLARQMAGWLAFLLVLGLARNLQGGMVQIDNAAHLGGALGGAAIAASWQRGVRYGARLQRLVVGLSAGIVVVSGLAVPVRVRLNPYLAMSLDERLDAALAAAHADRCDVAEEAVRSARRLDPRGERIQRHAAELSRTCPTAR